MPIPLSAMMPTTTASKPGAHPQEPRAEKGTASFQTVMDQETDTPPGEAEMPEIVIQDPDAAVELEEVVVEVETSGLAAAPEDQPPAEIRPVAPETIQKVGSETRPDVPTAPAGSAGSETNTDVTRDTPPIILGRAADKPVQRAAPLAFQALVFEATAPRNPPDLISNLQSIPAGLAEAGPKDVPVPSTPITSVPDGPIPPITPAPAQPKHPDRAPTFVQMQLLATEQTNVQTETRMMPELDDIQPLRENSAPSAARDAGPAIQAMKASARAETARAVANQMATVINARTQPGMIEVALNPEELGRVSIVMNGRDDGLQMTIAAERPETLDLMRRHLSVLEAEFQNLGLGNLSVDLGASADAQHGDSDSGENTRFTETQSEQAAENTPSILKLGSDGRIDMRL